MNTSTKNRLQTHQASNSPMSSAPCRLPETSGFRETGYGSTTYGVLGYKRVENGPDIAGAPFDLEARLAALCDKLRARY